MGEGDGVSDQHDAQSAWVHHGDFGGIVAADGVDAQEPAGMYALAGLDSGRWAILAVDLRRWRGGDSVIVYALDRAKYGVGDRDELMALAARLGHLPVVRFRVPVADLLAFVDASFTRFSARLVHRGVEGYPLTVVGAEESGSA